MTHSPPAAGFVAVLALVLAVSCQTAPPDPAAAPEPTLHGAAAVTSWTRAQHVFDTRCVVCHGCFDAPCQLKLDSFEGMARGANPAPVYAARPLAAEPTRLFVDAQDAAGWRTKGFHAVVPEVGSGDINDSVLLRMLALKRQHPLTPTTDVASSFTLELGRKQECATDKTIDRYAREHPLWGMPYGLPGLSADDDATLVSWVKAGMPHPPAAPLPTSLLSSVADWEAFLNDDSLRGRLVARYLFEHLFFASLYVEGHNDTFFQMVRSRTPTGIPVDEIATRRPFDDPHTERVFYRLVQRVRLPLDKTHMPWALSPARKAWLTKLFLGKDVVVTSWPGYDPLVAANPFKAFAALPVASRYRFLLEDAAFTLMGFVKGPVCRGSVALNVINDRFWVAFVDPDAPWMAEQAHLLEDNAPLLDMPAEGGSNPTWTQWIQYAGHHKQYLDRKNAALKGLADAGHGLTVDAIWDGDGENDNAALTVFRHDDHGSVVKGFVGAEPSTGFVLDYAVLERISYLLVSGFDVFGGIGHQLQTRLYMDFLRMEAEANFLAFLPSSRRRPLVDRWYRDLSSSKKSDIVEFFAPSPGEPHPSASALTEQTLFAAIEHRVAKVAAQRFETSVVKDDDVKAALEKLGTVAGLPASLMPELSFVRVTDDHRPDVWFTVARDSAHSNVSLMFDEDARRLTAEDTLTALPGLMGAYPGALFVVPRGELVAFVAAVTGLDGAAAYGSLRGHFGVLRSSPDFWAVSDALHTAARALDPLGAGAFDYGRLDAR